MTFAAHTVLAYGIGAGLGKMMHSGRVWVWGVLLALTGLVPDVLKEFGVPHESLTGVWTYIFGLHLIPDAYAHAIGDWWSQLWWVEILHWLIGGVLIYLAHRRE